MARKTKTRPKPKAKAPAKKAPARPAAKAKSKHSEVEQRWKEYWRRRQELETAVTKVREAQESLAKAKEIETRLRSEFDEVKRALKTLLDVEPAHQGGGAPGGLGPPIKDELN